MNYDLTELLRRDVCTLDNSIRNSRYMIGLLDQNSFLFEYDSTHARMALQGHVSWIEHFENLVTLRAQL